MAFFRAGFLEETLKLLAVVSIYRNDYVCDPQSLILYSATGACGFALVENLQYILSQQSVGAMVSVGVVRAALSIPLHVGTGIIIGAMLGRRRFLGIENNIASEKLGFLHVLFLPVLLHGSYEFSFEFQGSAFILPSTLLIVISTWFIGRWEYAKIHTNPIVGPIPLVDIRSPGRGIIPHARLIDQVPDWVYGNICCCCTPREHVSLSTLRSAAAGATATNGKDHNAPLLPVTMRNCPDDAMVQSGGSLFCCFSDWQSCCLGYFLPCVLFGRTYRKAGEGSETEGCLKYTCVMLGQAVAFYCFILLTVMMFATLLLDWLFRGGLVGKAHTNEDDVRMLRVFFWAACVVPCVIVGLFAGRHRERVRASLGDVDLDASVTCGSFWLHCCPMTHVLALCQESRAVQADHKPADVSKRRVAGVTACAVLAVTATVVVMVVTSVPPPPPPPTSPWAQNFEESNWNTADNVVQSPISQQPWTWTQGSTPSDHTGPDAAYEGTHYLYTEATNHRNEEFILDVVQPLIAGSEYTFELWYHMRGYDTGSLSIEMADAGDTSTNTWTVLWTVSGQQQASSSSDWLRAEVVITVTADIVLRIKGVTGSNYRSDIAIDAVSLVPGEGA